MDLYAHRWIIDQMIKQDIDPTPTIEATEHAKKQGLRNIKGFAETVEEGVKGTAIEGGGGNGGEAKNKKGGGKRKGKGKGKKGRKA